MVVPDHAESKDKSKGEKLQMKGNTHSGTCFPGQLIKRKEGKTKEKTSQKRPGTGKSFFLYG